METKAARNLVNDISKQRNMAVMLLILVLILLIILSLALFTKDEKIILVPANMSQEMYIKQGNVSEHYIKDLATNVVEKFLNITSYDYSVKEESLLHMASARYVHDLREVLEKRKKEYVKEKIATYFIVKTIEVEGMRATVKGKLETKYDREIMESEKQTYEISFIPDAQFIAKLDHIRLTKGDE